MPSRRLLLAALALLGGCTRPEYVQTFLLVPEPLPAVDARQVRFLDGIHPEGCQQVVRMSVGGRDESGLREAFAETAARRGANVVVLETPETSRRLVALNGMATTLVDHTYRGLALRCP